MSKRIIFDSFALICLFQQERGYHEVINLLMEVTDGKREASMCTVNLGEVYYTTCRKQGKAKAEEVLAAALQFPVEIVDPDFEQTYQAAQLKCKYKLSYADAFAAALTIKRKGTLITGDKGFKHLEGETNFKVMYIT